MYHDATLSEEKILEQFNTSLSEGLSSRRAGELIATAGYNEITATQVHWSGNRNTTVQVGVQSTCS